MQSLSQLHPNMQVVSHGSFNQYWCSVCCDFTLMRIMHTYDFSIPTGPWGSPWESLQNKTGLSLLNLGFFMCHTCWSKVCQPSVLYGRKFPPVQSSGDCSQNDTIIWQQRKNIRVAYWALVVCTTDCCWNPSIYSNLSKVQSLALRSQKHWHCLSENGTHRLPNMGCQCAVQKCGSDFLGIQVSNCWFQIFRLYTIDEYL